MKVHFRVVRNNAFGGTNTSSLCGRLNKSCNDGMNITDEPREVTCGFCLKDPRCVRTDDRRSAKADGK